MSIISGAILSLDVDGQFSVSCINSNVGLQSWMVGEVMCDRPILTLDELKASIQKGIDDLKEVCKDSPEFCDKVGTMDCKDVQVFLDFDNGWTEMYVYVDEETTYWFKVEKYIRTIPTDTGRLLENQIVELVQSVCSSVTKLKDKHYLLECNGKQIDMELVKRIECFPYYDVKLVDRNNVQGQHHFWNTDHVELKILTALTCMVE